MPPPAAEIRAETGQFVGFARPKKLRRFNPGGRTDASESRGPQCAAGGSGIQARAWHEVRYYFFFLSGRWLSAEPAAVLLFLPVLPLFRTLEAALPAFFPVCSFLAMA
jgi:hypothetical protein